MFTGMVDERRSKIISNLGGDISTSIESCTHLVTDKVHRTIKFLAALCRGLPIVSYKWIDKCSKEKAFVDEGPFIVKDVASERKFHFSLVKSIQTARAHPLMQGMSFYVTKNTKPDPESMKTIIEAGGGQLRRTKPRTKEGGLIIISCPEDKPIYTSLHALGYTIHSAELILTGVLQQSLDLESHTLVAQDQEGDTAVDLASPMALRNRKKINCTQKNKNPTKM